MLSTSSPPARPLPTGGALRVRDLPGWAPFLLIVLFGFGAYGLALNADFYMDDYDFVLGKEAVRGGAWDIHGHGFRQIPFLLWRITHSLFGASSVAFHLLNLGAHLGCGAACYGLGRALLPRFNCSEITARRAALAGASVFVVHPFGSEAVNYARCLELLLVTLFSLLGARCLLHLAQRPTALRGAALVGCGVAATFCKEPGLFHFASIVLLIGGALILSRPSGLRACSPRRLPKPLIFGAGVPAGLLAAILATRWAGIAAAKLEAEGIANYWEHWLTQGRVFFAYLARAIAPVGMSSDHLVPFSTGASDLPALAGLIATAALAVGLAAVLIRSARWRLPALLALLAIAPLLLRFLYPNDEIFVEYRAYPGLPFAGLLAGLALSKLYDARPAVGKWAPLALLLAFAGLAFQRSATWGNAEWLAADVLERYPLNNRARTQLQAFAYQAGDYRRVLELRDEAVARAKDLRLSAGSLPWDRRYDRARVAHNRANSEQLAALAIAELAGSQKAIAYAKAALTDLGDRYGPWASEEEFEGVLGSLVHVRNELLENGAANDRRRAAQATEERP